MPSKAASNDSKTHNANYVIAYTRTQSNNLHSTSVDLLSLSMAIYSQANESGRTSNSISNAILFGNDKNCKTQKIMPCISTYSQFHPPPPILECCEDHFSRNSQLALAIACSADSAAEIAGAHLSNSSS
jgi:hypothetical protein